MNTTLVIWYVGVLITTISINLRLLSISLNDRLEYPLRVASLYNAVFLLVAGAAAYALVGDPLLVLYIALLSLGLLGVIFYVLKQRDVKGLKLGEKIIAASYLADLQLLYALSNLAEPVPGVDVRVTVENGLNFILSQLAEILHFGERRAAENWLSIFLVKKSGKFKVIAHQGISNNLLPVIEATFRHKKKIKSVAGYAVDRCEYVCITDLATSQHPAARCWAGLTPEMRKQGSIICLPIARSVGEAGEPQAIAVLCVSSIEADAYDCASLKEVLERFAPKIESLMYCYRLHERLEG